MDAYFLHLYLEPEPVVEVEGAETRDYPSWCHAVITRCQEVMRAGPAVRLGRQMRMHNEDGQS
jgi:hypothetical protein